MKLGRIHLGVGLLFIFIFLATGLYMHLGHGHLQGMEAGRRMLYRSAHIYILLAAVMNVLYGYNHSPAVARGYRVLQGTVSAILFIAPGMFTLGFFFEPDLEMLVRPYCRWGIYLLFGVGVVLSIAGLKGRGETPAQD